MILPPMQRWKDGIEIINHVTQYTIERLKKYIRRSHSQVY